MIKETKERAAYIYNMKVSILKDILYDMASTQEYKGITKKKLMELTGLHQSEVSDLLNGRLERFSVDRLVIMLLCLGHKPTINII